MMHVGIPRTPAGVRFFNEWLTRQPIRAAVPHAAGVRGNKPGVSEQSEPPLGTNKAQNRTPAGVRG